MSKRLTFIRHGETASNLKKFFNEASEPLNDTGRSQAEKIGTALAEEEFDVVLCSPMTRTKETASFLPEQHKKLIQYWDEIVEIDWGDYSGKPYVEGENAFEGLDKNRFGESLEDLEIRAKLFWSQLDKCEEERILIVSHGAIMCILFAVKAGLESCEFSKFRAHDWVFMGNCDQKKIEL